MTSRIGRPSKYGEALSKLCWRTPHHGASIADGFPPLEREVARIALNQMPKRLGFGPHHTMIQTPSGLQPAWFGYQWAISGMSASQRAALGERVALLGSLHLLSPESRHIRECVTRVATRLGHHQDKSVYLSALFFELDTWGFDVDVDVRLHQPNGFLSVDIVINHSWILLVRIKQALTIFDRLLACMLLINLYKRDVMVVNFGSNQSVNHDFFGVNHSQIRNNALLNP